MKALFTKEIKNHIKTDIEVGGYDDWAIFLKGFNVVEWKLIRVVEDAHLENNKRGQMLQYRVATSHKAPKYQDNRVEWTVNVYQDNHIGVYFEGTSYIG